MSDMEEIVRMFVHASQWIKLRMYEEHGIAVCMYHPDTEEAHKIFVVAFRGSRTPFYGIQIGSIPGTERRFRAKEKKIARWYFRELCRYLKEGILVPECEEEGGHKKRWGRRR